VSGSNGTYLLIRDNLRPVCWHTDVLDGTDFFTVEVPAGRGLVTYYVLFFLHLETRRHPLSKNDDSVCASRIYRRPRSDVLFIPVVEVVVGGVRHERLLTHIAEHGATGSGGRSSNRVFLDGLRSRRARLRFPGHS
jgi:hypothetical protein